ncbi:MAG: hypothetical protein AB1Z57_08275 [Acidimicrobiia bacterium]
MTDEASWAKPIGEISGAAGHLEGRRLTGPQQGFGQLWQKTYRVTIPGHTPEEVVETWKAEYGDFWPRHSKFNAPLAGIKPGEVGSIDSMQVLSTGVMVMYADTTSFAFMTPEGHPFSGWITFSAEAIEGGTQAQVQLLIRASDPLYEVAMAFGMGKGEDAMWRHVLQSLAKRHGVAVKATQDLVKVDRKRLWDNAGNWKRNAVFTRGRKRA